VQRYNPTLYRDEDGGLCTHTIRRTRAI